MSDLLIQAMSAKQRGDINLAKQLLSQAIVQNPHDEASWMLMAELMDDAKLRRNCLERVLAINPNNEAALLALTKLNTSPLGPVMRGEREKPIDTPKFEKTPPFTPPFTWSGEPEQFLALGELTVPELSPEEEQQLPETLPTFDWANDSPEPNKTIEKIFDAVSNPELASEPPPAKEKDWLDDLRPKDEIEGTSNGHQEVEDPWLKELVGTDAEEVQAPAMENPTDFSVSSEPEWGLAAFATDDQPSDASADLNSLLWDNPHAKTDRLVILGHHSLIYADPADSDMPHILGLFSENKMIRDLLGDQARMIKLASIDRVSTNPKASNMIIDFTLDEKPATHELIFSSPQIRDEVLNALKLRLEAGFKESHRTVSLEDKILSPLAILILVAILAAALLGGVPLLSSLPGFDSGTPQAVLASLQGFIDGIGPITIILIAAVIALACIYWLVRNLRKPSDLVILKR
jgi:hypothetical protein